MNLAQWAGARVFQLIHGHHLVYNTCWEDPRLDRAAMDLKPHDTVMAITSAGCNVLSYALDEPARIFSVDMNPRQNALLELKVAGIKQLDYEDFFALFGRGSLPGFPEIYRKTLRSNLAPRSRAWWDGHTHYFSGGTRHKSFYFQGSAGWIARLMNIYIDHIARIRHEMETLMAATSISEQERIYEAIADRFWSPMLCWALNRDSFLSMVGVPKSQRLQLEKDCAGGVIDYLKERLGVVFAKLSMTDNYFWRVYLSGRYRPDCCPDFLKPEHFQRLKAGLVDRISIHTSTVEEFLRKCREPISRFVLLDHMDWLSSFELSALESEWQAIVDRAPPHSRLLWRSGGLQVDYVDPLRVQYKGRQVTVGDLLTYNPSLAGKLHARDRVGTYGSFYIADMELD